MAKQPLAHLNMTFSPEAYLPIPGDVVHVSQENIPAAPQGTQGMTNTEGDIPFTILSIEHIEHQEGRLLVVYKAVHVASTKKESPTTNAVH